LKHIGIYIHIPFCKRRCYYCDFISYENKQKQIEQYIEALKKEIEFYDLKQYSIDTIYIGGGTPSYIGSKYISQILKEIPHLNKTEITIEINPGTIDGNILNEYAKAGINRLSIGLQSTDNKILKKIGRIHTYQEFEETYRLARKKGFKNINIDLMLALPGQTLEILTQSVKKVIELEPEHISIYSLILEEGTKLEQLVQNGIINICSDEKEREMYWNIKKQLEELGYIHYEISNFSKKGYQSRHNTDCWEQKEYIGLGVAAHSFKNKIRYNNIDNIDEYIKNIQNGYIIKNQVQNEKLTKENEMNEYMMLGLRKIEGIEVNKFQIKFKVNPLELYKKQIKILQSNELVTVDTNKIKLTKKGLDLANIVWEQFI